MTSEAVGRLFKEKRMRLGVAISSLKPKHFDSKTNTVQLAQWLAVWPPTNAA